MEKDKNGEIEVNNLHIIYQGRKAICALKDVSFKVKPQEFLGVVGTTGCGKSTLLNVLAGFIKPTSGNVLLDGKPIDGPDPKRGMVFQSHALFPWKNVGENIEFGLKMKGMEKTKRKTLVNRFIKLVGLEGFQDSYPKELSGGMLQRVGIARVLVNDPLVMLMDEPFGSLDAQTRVMMQELLLNIWEEFHKTVIFVTHDIDEAILLSDRILILTARPASIKEEIKVNLPRPRDYTTLVSSSFITIKEKVLGLIREETIKAINQTTHQLLEISHPNTEGKK